jgi:predicted DNA-binding transcriptional regulator YafY
MKSKIMRIKKIRSHLRLQSNPSTITEIHEALTRRQGLEVSRKTVERDLDELVEAKVVMFTPGLPTRYTLRPIEEVEIILTIEEVRKLISLLDEKSDLTMKLKRSLAF